MILDTGESQTSLPYSMERLKLVEKPTTSLIEGPPKSSAKSLEHCDI